MQFKTVALALLPAVVSAATVNVTVGAGGGFTFEPNQITAAVGDVVSFTITGNHSVTQVPFDSPCTSAASGFDSGFDAASLTGSVNFQITVNDTNPIWLKCAQNVLANHCSLGMVAAINAPTDGSNTFSAYQTGAMAQACPTSTKTSTGGGYGYFVCATPAPAAGSAMSTKVGVAGLLSAAVLAASALL